MNGLALLALASVLLLLPRLLLLNPRELFAPRRRHEIHAGLHILHWIMMAYCGLMYRLRSWPSCAG